MRAHVDDEPLTARVMPCLMTARFAFAAVGSGPQLGVAVRSFIGLLRGTLWPGSGRARGRWVEGAVDDGLDDLANGVRLDVARSCHEREQCTPVQRHEGGDRLW